MSCYRLTVPAVPPQDVVTSIEHLHLDPVPRVVGAARRFLREQLPPVPAPRLEDLLLLTSELVTNAVIHARTPVEVGVTVTDRSIIVTVHDEDLGPPPARAGREGGWGLGLVRELAEDFAVEPHAGDGKTAWFRVSRGEPTR